MIRDCPININLEKTWGWGVPFDRKRPWEKSQSTALLKSSTTLLANCQTCWWERQLSSWTTLFLLYHIAQAIPKKNSRSGWEWWERMNMAESMKDHRTSCVPKGFSDHWFQTRVEKSQLRRAWLMLSGAFSQIGQPLLLLIPLLQIASMVGRPLTQALQAKILTLAGRLRCQSLFQSAFYGSPEEHSPSFFASIRL